MPCVSFPSITSRTEDTLAQELEGSKVLMVPRRVVQDKGLLFPHSLSASSPDSRPTVLGVEARSTKDQPWAEPQCLQWWWGELEHGACSTLEMDTCWLGSVCHLPGVSPTPQSASLGWGGSPSWGSTHGSAHKVWEGAGFMNK